MMNLFQFAIACADVRAKQYLDLSCLHELPCYIYMKDKAGRYIGVNNYLIKDVGYTNESDLHGMTDFDLCQEKTAESLIKNDSAIMAREQAITFIEPIVFLNDRRVTSISYKAPLRSRDNKMLGIIGLSIVQHDVMPQLGVGSNPVETMLTAREKEIARWLIRGKTAKEIAETLGVSRRTVEHHIENIKNKAGAVTKSELIEMLINHCGFIA